MTETTLYWRPWSAALAPPAALAETGAEYRLVEIDRETAQADPAYADETAKKLQPILLSMDSGPDKAKMNRVEVIANGRQIDLLMSAGCDAKTPFRAVVTRAGIPWATLVSHGVFVIRCNDAHVQCLQSTRDPEDVLCATGIRHK